MAAPRAHAGVVANRVKSRQQVRICIWPEYYGITYRDPRTQRLRGLDVDLSAALAGDLGVKPVYVDSSFPTLINDVRSDRCDVAMFAIGVLPQRQAALRFTQPYLQSDVYGVTVHASRIVRNWDDIDKPGVNVAVQAGTFMEPVMRASLKQASLVVIAPPQTREQELQAGRIDVFMTDYPYSRRLLDNADWARLISPPQPFHPLPYAYAMRQDDEEWYKTINDFVERIKHDGRLEQAARRHGLTEVMIRK
nr:ABC transporter substrate-binding protein [Ralstonia solanacearum]